MKFKPLLLSILFCLPLSLEGTINAEGTEGKSKFSITQSNESVEGQINLLQEQATREENTGQYQKALFDALTPELIDNLHKFPVQFLASNKQYHYQTLWDQYLF